MLSALRSVLAFGLASAVVVLAVPACSQQGEGERCDYAKNGNEDCESGLTCVLKDSLLERVTDRCCPPEGTGNSSRCRRRTGADDTGGTGGTGGTDTGGTGGTGGTDAGGTDTGGTGGSDVAGNAGAGAVDAGGADGG